MGHQTTYIPAVPVLQLAVSTRRFNCITGSEGTAAEECRGRENDSGKVGGKLHDYCCVSKNEWSGGRRNLMAKGRDFIASRIGTKCYSLGSPVFIRSPDLITATYTLGVCNITV